MAEIIIRAATPKDVEELHKLHTYPQVYAQTLQLPYATTEVWEKLMSNCLCYKSVKNNCTSY